MTVCDDHVGEPVTVHISQHRPHPSVREFVECAGRRRGAEAYAVALEQRQGHAPGADRVGHHYVGIAVPVHITDDEARGGELDAGDLAPKDRGRDWISRVSGRQYDPQVEPDGPPLMHHDDVVETIVVHVGRLEACQVIAETARQRAPWSGGLEAVTAVLLSNQNSHRRPGPMRDHQIGRALRRIGRAFRRIGRAVRTESPWDGALDIEQNLPVPSVHVDDNGGLLEDGRTPVPHRHPVETCVAGVRGDPEVDTWPISPAVLDEHVGATVICRSRRRSGAGCCCR